MAEKDPNATAAFKMILGAILGIALGACVAHWIQFDLKFFGAPFVTFGDVCELWSTAIVIGGCSGAWVGITLASKKKS